MLLIAAVTVTFTACQIRLDPAGAYHGNKLLYSADKTIDATRQSIQSFLSWEKTNEVYLMANAPSITRAADAMRDKAPVVLKGAVTVRDKYEELVLSVTAMPPEVQNASNNLTQALGDLQIYTANANKQKTLVTIPASQ